MAMDASCPQHGDTLHVTKVSSLPRTGTTDTKGVVDGGAVGLSVWASVGAFAARTRSRVDLTSQSRIVRQLSPAPDLGDASRPWAFKTVMYAAMALWCVYGLFGIPNLRIFGGSHWHCSASRR